MNTILLHFVDQNSNIHYISMKHKYHLSFTFLNYLIVTLSLFVFAFCQDADETIIDLKNITTFPADDKNVIRAGYLNITPFNQAIYYIYVQSQLPTYEHDPVILWLNGGPGCSSLMGFLTEIGPYKFTEGTTKMEINPYAWNKKANVIYFQSPAGVGFSFAQGKYLIANDTSTAQDNLKALLMLFNRYKWLKNAPFYIAGESYAGVYIPMLAEQIVNFNEGLDQSDNRINLRGILIGNGCTHELEYGRKTQYSRFTYQFFFTRGFFEESDYVRYKNTCLEDENSPACLKVEGELYHQWESYGANIYNIYAKCYHPVYPPKLSQKLFRSQLTHKNLKHPLRCSDAIGSLTLLNANQFRLAFKIQEYNDTLLWTPCSDIINYTINKKAVYQILPTLVKAGLKIIYFTGDQDAIVPITGTLFWFQKYREDYGMSIKKSWRPWVAQNQNTSGMVWELEGLTLTTVRGAGHMVPTDKPIEAQEILNIMLGDSTADWKYPDYYIRSQQE